MIRKILIGLDGSAGSRRACEWAAQLAGNLEAEVIAVGVADLTPYFHTITPETAMLIPDPVSLEKTLDDYLRAEWTQPLRDARVRYRTIATSGRPADRLIEVATDEKADLVVVGTHGRGALAEFVIGSVSHALTHHAHLPVVVVPTYPKGEQQTISGSGGERAPVTDPVSKASGGPLDE